MNYSKLLSRQIKKYLPENLSENPDLVRFLSVVNDSYSALERDKELVERAFNISEEEYIDLNKKLAHEIELKEKSVKKLKSTIEEIGGIQIKGEKNDLLSITEYLNEQIIQRRSAEKVFSSLVNNSESGILLEDENRKIVFTNQLFCDMFQIPASPEQLIGADCSDSAEQTKSLFKNPEEFKQTIDQLLKNRLFKSENLKMADDRILKREYIPIYIDDLYKGHLWSYTDITETKKAQEALEQSELKNRLIMNSALDAIITIDNRGLITFWNPQAEAIFGWNENEVLGMKLSNTIIPSYHKNGHESGMKNYNETGRGPVLNKIMELPAVNKEGIEFPIELSIIPVKQGDTEFFCSFIRDISDRKKSEQDLKASQELWQFALEGAGDGVWEYNFQTDEVFFSKQYKKMLGYEEDEFENNSNEWRIRIHPDDYAIISETDKDYLEKKITTHQREYRIKHKNGSYKWILDRGMIISYTDDGKPLRVIGTHSDITERKLTEQALKIREEKYRSILANMNLGLVEVDHDDIIQFANNSFSIMSGYKSDELVGKKASEVLLDSESRNIIQKKNELRKTGLSDAFEIPVKDKNGNQKWWLISGAPRLNDAGELVGSVGIHLDITEQKNLEKDLIKARDDAQASTEAKENFLANMSHEIRTPMNAILGMANQLNKSNLNDNQQFYLDTIRSSADNLLIIINDILDLSKIESGKLSIESIGFEPQKVIKHVMQVMQHRAEEKGLKFTNSFFDGQHSPVLMGDPHRLSQIMLNLISNAIKFTQKGSVDIVSRVLADFEDFQIVQLSVTDTGIGMDENFLEKLFDKFSQEDGSVSRKFGGTGLGMSICKELVELMGGEISVNSIKGKGTEISFILKLGKGDMKDLPTKTDIETDTKLLNGKNVLVTDDNEINRLLASTILANFGAIITEAKNGKEALEMVKSGAFDIVLMDVQMPVMDGIEATINIRQSVDKNIPIIALTAFALKGDNQKCFDAGMNDYLSKPFEESQLIEIVAKWLNKGALLSPIKVDRIESEELFSLKQLESIARGNKDFVKKMIDLFVAQSTTAIEEIKSAYEEEDYTKLSKIAHRIKPSIDNMGIISLKQTIREIETKAIDYRKSNQLTDLIDKVKMVFEEVNEALLKY